jgi:hypothetical protein
VRLIKTNNGWDFHTFYRSKRCIGGGAKGKKGEKPAAEVEDWAKVEFHFD